LANIGDPGGEHTEWERLAYHLHARAKVLHRRRAGVAGDEQHGQARPACARGIGDLPPIQTVGQSHIGDKQVHSGDASEKSQRRGAILGLQHLIADFA
jgi:hypothetical protein